MRGLETEPSASAHHEALGSLLTAPEVQLALMLISHKQRHEREADLSNIDPTALESVSEGRFTEAGEEWVDETKGLSLSDRLRFYAIENPDERIDAKNQPALIELLEKIRDWQPKTLH